MINSIRNSMLGFLSSSNNTKSFPVIAALGAGLYPLLHFYNSNFTLMNSWRQFMFFLLFFLFVPILIFTLVLFLVKNIKYLKKYIKYVIPILNYSAFTAFLVIITFGFHKLYLLVSLVIAVISGKFMYKHIKKIIVFQLLLAVLGCTRLIPVFYKYFSYSSEWMNQNDGIESVYLKNKPNIYLIQPDGYVNFSQLNKGYYNFKNSEFKAFLINNNFELYDDYRSNYRSTLSSNSSMFAMKHHYYKMERSFSESYNAREIIAGENPVISILKKNNYKTFFLTEKSYLLVNRPKRFYDFCNVDYKDISYFDMGWNDVSLDIKEDLNQVIKNNSKTNNFYFVEKLTPGHISNFNSMGIEKERDNYLRKIEMTNVWLKEVVLMIQKNDPEAIIVISADHGGFVGLNSASETKNKKDDDDLVNSIFSSMLAIKWPNNKVPDFDDKIKTPVNLFRILFSYLSENEIYLEHLQEDKSFISIEEGAPPGVYEYINEQGEVVFNKVSD